jgi:hypothetical protein
MYQDVVSKTNRFDRRIAGDRYPGVGAASAAKVIAVKAASTGLWIDAHRCAQHILHPWLSEKWYRDVPFTDLRME